MVSPVRPGAVIVYVRDFGAAVELLERAFGLERGAIAGDDYAEPQAGSATVV